jgi:ChAPs (Chs5p-Arf1p-binding proteins)
MPTMPQRVSSQTDMLLHLQGTALGPPLAPRPRVYICPPLSTLARLRTRPMLAWHHKRAGLCRAIARDNVAEFKAISGAKAERDVAVSRPASFAFSHPSRRLTDHDPDHPAMPYPPLVLQMGSYLYISGIDMSLSTSLAAYINSLTHSVEEPQAWFTKGLTWKVKTGCF